MHTLIKPEKQPFLKVFFSLIALIAILQCTFSWLIFFFSREQVQATIERFDSLKIVYELAQSSENLTRMAQNYVITREDAYRNNYNTILAIRNGKAPRPENYEFFYWDAVPPPEARNTTPARSLIQLAEDLSFSNQEFELFSQAINLSSNLTILENTAMNAVEGKFDDGSGTFSLRGPPNITLATDLLFDDHYWAQKRQIFLPIQQLAMLVIDRTQERLETLNEKMGFFMTLSRSLSLFAAFFMIVVVVKAVRSLSAASRTNELLLLNVFPQKIVERLRKGEETIADEYQASVLFADIVDFTKSTYQLGPTKVVQLLNELFGEFDKIVDCFGVEKVKTIGDNYMAVAGVPIPVPDHSMRLADFALALKDLLLHFNEKHDLQVQMRIGMDCGTLIAGIIGHKKSIYDVWGDVVNTASRMESTSLQGEIQVSEKMALLLEEKFLLQAREPFEVKGKGLMQTYFLKGKKVIS